MLRHLHIALPAFLITLTCLVDRYQLPLINGDTEARSTSLICSGSGSWIVGLNRKRKFGKAGLGPPAPQNLRGAEDLSSLPLCSQNILSQTEEGSSRQENAQKALGAVSKVGSREAEEGRGAEWQGGSRREYAGMGG